MIFLMFLQFDYYLSSVSPCITVPFTGQACTSSPQNPLHYIALQLYCTCNYL